MFIRQVKVQTYPQDDICSIIKYRTRNNSRDYLLPHGNIPPAKFVDNIKDGPWHCLDEIVKYFSNSPSLTSADEALPSVNTVKLVDGNEALVDWLKFAAVFPRNDDGMGHERFASARPDLYHVPFAESFASDHRGKYDNAVMDVLIGGISYDKESLPKAITMPSVQFGVKQIAKGSARDIDNRQFADGSIVVRASKRTTQELLVSRKQRKINDDDGPKRLALEAKKAAANEKRLKKLAEQTRKANLTDSERKRERADKARATRERNRAEKAAMMSMSN